jgi:hypothetical protein
VDLSERRNPRDEEHPVTKSFITLLFTLNNIRANRWERLVARTEKMGNFYTISVQKPEGDLEVDGCEGVDWIQVA